MTNQPTWKYAGHIGDTDPIAYGGGFVYTDETGVYAPELTFFEPAPDAVWHDIGDSAPVQLYRFTLDRLEQLQTPEGVLLVPFGFPARTDLPHPIADYNEWFAGDLKSVTDSIGQTIEELRAQLCDANPMVRAGAYESIARHFGFDNFDSDPFTLTEKECYEKYAAEMRAIRTPGGVA